MAMNPVTHDTFPAEVLESEQPVLVDFWAAWCPPCRLMNPILDELDSERDDIKIVSVDADNEQALAVEYGVLGLPTFVLFRNGAPVTSLVGARPKRRLESELEQALVEQPAGRGRPGGPPKQGQPVARRVDEIRRADHRPRPLEPGRRDERDPQLR